MKNYNITIDKSQYSPVYEVLINSSKTVEQLSNVELLSLFFEDGNSVGEKELVKRIICNGPLRSFQTITIQELIALGVPDQKAASLVAIMELAKRSFKALDTKQQIFSSDELGEILMTEIGSEPQEILIAFYLNSQNRVIEQRTIYKGTVNRSLAESREILHYAVKNLATSVIVAHNHPSGFIKPSENDDSFTKKFVKSCDILGIIPLDHFIIGKEEYYSYREETDFFR